MEINCNVIRDLLPLYAEDMVSEDSRNVVEKHLCDCEACSQELDKLRKPAPSVLDTDIFAIEMVSKSVMKKFVLVTVSFLLILSAVLFGLYMNVTRMIPWDADCIVSVERLYGDDIITSYRSVEYFFDIRAVGTGLATGILNGEFGEEEQSAKAYGSRKLDWPGYAESEWGTSYECGEIQAEWDGELRTWYNGSLFYYTGRIWDEPVYLCGPDGASKELKLIEENLWMEQLTLVFFIAMIAAAFVGVFCFFTLWRMERGTAKSILIAVGLLCLSFVVSVGFVNDFDFTSLNLWRDLIGVGIMTPVLWCGLMITVKLRKD